VLKEGLSSQDTFYFHRREALKSSNKQTCELALRSNVGSLFHARLDSVRAEIDGEPAIRIILTDMSERRQAEEEDREKLILALGEALSEIKTLSGSLPICAACKKIRNDKGYWEQVEVYMKNHSYTDFSHDICPECAEK
jgi:hypothetical protein